MSAPQAEGPTFVDELVEYGRNLWSWLSRPKVWGLTLMAVGLSVNGFRDGQTRWAVLVGIATLLFLCIPPVLLAATRAEMRSEWWRLLLATGAGIAVGLIGWKAGLGYGALAMLAIVLTALADL